ncbi:hypothetical protein G7046_g3851 [Stylonectria norvegica]|nr:hypothetical protein G7046_g3851 [Stylonectria norvegica]
MHLSRPRAKQIKLIVGLCTPDGDYTVASRVTSSLVLFHRCCVELRRRGCSPSSNRQLESRSSTTTHSNMQDAGGDSVDQEAQVLESGLRETRIKNDNAHLDPSRWWFASSAFPMIAGTLGPVASAFSICALVRPWRQRLVGGANPQEAPFSPDEIWLTVVNAAQLAIAIVSNVFLLLNMAKRVRFSIAQPITIVGWYISAICLIALVSTATGPLDEGIGFPKEELVWSQAFFYGIWAAILYFVDASLMAVTFYGASAGRYEKDFNLTPSQRTLMLQTIMFLMYLLLGALVFCNIEGWNYLDAVYWADVTLFTVGFGDYSPMTNLGRALMMPYALVGVISLGLVIGSIRSLVLERGKRRVDARLEEKKRRRVVRTMTLKGKDAILEPIHNDYAITRTVSDPLPGTEYERRKAEFQLMRKVQAQSSTRRRWMAMAISGSAWLILWLVGAYIFMKSEEPYQDWNYYDSVYFCFIALVTIGYGDLTPISNSGKSFFVFWSLLALPTMTVLISNAGDTVVKFIRDGTLRLGNITILPGEEGFSGNIKHIVSKLTFGKAFPNHIDDVNMGAIESLKGNDRRFAEPMEESGELASQDDSQGRSSEPNLGEGLTRAGRPQRGRSSSTYTAQVRRSLSRLRDSRSDLPTGNDLHFLLISEIQAMAAHQRLSHPRRYTFEEWAWYLKLIGEDESSAETHRKAKPRQKHHHDDAEDSDAELTWSWVGNRSPLMGSQEESEWIMERLMDRLRECLSLQGRRQRNAKGSSRATTGGDWDHANGTNEKR